EMKDYPKPQYIGPFYAQSVSLVEYLSSLKGPQEFTAFLRDGLRGGYEPALKKHFGIDSYADLDRRWNAYAFGQQSAATAEYPRGWCEPREPAGCARGERDGARSCAARPWLTPRARGLFKIHRPLLFS